jgi:NTE family protein
VPRIEAVTVAEDSRRYERLLRAGFTDLASAEGLDAALTTLYSRGNFESVDYALRAGNQGDVLELRARRNSWGPNYVRFGLNLEDDFNGNSSYNAAARFVLADIGPLAAEWVWDLQVGSEPKIATEMYIPFGDSARWFTMPSARFELRNVPLLDAGERRAEYRLRTTEYGVDLGRELGNWGEWRTGLRRVTGHSRLRVGDPQLPVTEDFDVREFFGRFSYDELDNRNFPRRGQYLVAEWRAETPRLGSDRRADMVTIDWLAARSSGRHTGVLWTSYGTTVDSEVDSIRALFPLGGFLNLSGLPPDSLTGRHFAITRLMYYRQIGRGGEGFLNVPAYVGLSLEAGNVWSERSDMGLSSALTQGSVFFGFDTLLGPVYLGSGFGESGETAFYLFLGRTF